VYNSFEEKLFISKICRKVPVFTALIKTAHSYGAEFDNQESLRDREQRLKMKMAAKRVFNR